MFDIKHDQSTSNVHHFPETLTNTIKAADSYGISDRALADILSNFLVDLEMITEADSSSVIDRNKIRRHLQRERHVVKQGCSAQICIGGALIKEYNMRKLVKQSYFSINQTCCNPHYE